MCEILNGENYTYIPYVSPGKDLSLSFNKPNGYNIVLLENHGLVCCGEFFVDVFNESFSRF